ncbi:MAG: radical SAM family heme chaperone HemW [Steroidobacteraceae bacterium]
MTAALPPLSLYLHFPWCVQKCPYCDFNSFTLHGKLPETAYVEALCRDLAQQAPPLAGRPIHSVFLGGGTPSLFSPRALEQVFDFVRSHFTLPPDTEITLEANPGTIERGRFAEYRAAGVNRVSLGAQSFDAATLKKLGRIHGPAEIGIAADELHAAGLDNFNLDLMFALPGQSKEGALADLESALALRPAHLSHYQLTIETGTVFAGTPPPLPDDDLAWDMQLACHERLAREGFEHYEVSAFARPGRRSAHNLNYWRFGDYIGAGAGAHGKLSHSLPDGIVRTKQPREPRRYLVHAGTAPETELVEAGRLPFEFALNALRLRDGFEGTLFADRTGLPLDRVSPTLRRAQARGLLEESAGGAWRPTELGTRFLNDLISEFLPAG